MATQKTEQDTAAIYKAIRAVINTTPLPATPIALFAVTELLDAGGDNPKHARGFLKLHYLAALHPETAAAVKVLCDMTVADALPQIRRLFAGMKV